MIDDAPEQESDRTRRHDFPEDDVELLRRMSPARKLSVMRSLIRQAYVLTATGVRAANPDLSEEEVRERVRNRIAGERS